MEFSEDLIKIFYKAWKEKRPVTINGINFYGEEFTTQGRIITTDTNQMGVYGDIIFLEFGQTKHSENSKQTEYFAAYQAAMVTNWDFGIFTIEIGGKVVYENPNKQKMIEESRIIAQEQKEEGRWTLPQCPVVEELKKMVGKPIALDNNRGVLHNVSMSVWGDPVVEIVRGAVVGAHTVKPNSILMTEDNNGRISILARNNPQEYEQSILNLKSNTSYDV